MAVLSCTLAAPAKPGHACIAVHCRIYFQWLACTVLSLRRDTSLPSFPTRRLRNQTTMDPLIHHSVCRWTPTMVDVASRVAIFGRADFCGFVLFLQETVSRRDCASKTRQIWSVLVSQLSTFALTANTRAPSQFHDSFLLRALHLPQSLHTLEVA